MIKAIFLDFDDTIYSHSLRKIPDSTVYAINEARKNSYFVFLCTGRAKAELDSFDLSSISFDGYILNNGELIYDENFNMLHMNTFNDDIKEKLIKLYNQKDMPIMICTPTNIYVNKINNFLVEVFNDIGTPVPKVKDISNENIAMVSIFFENEKGKIILDGIKSDTEITYWHNGAVDVMPKGTSKSSGIDKIIELFNIDIDETLSIGDGENDLQMIKHCGIGVAMGNALQSVKDIADYVTTNINDDGIYKTFQKYEIIK